MPSPTTEFAKKSRHVAALALIVGLSVALPCGVLFWSFKTTLFNKPFVAPASESKIYQGIYRDGELWFTTFRQLNDRGVMECLIKRLDLTTGAERETSLSFSGVYCYPIRMGDDLYGVTRQRLYRLSAASPEIVADLPPRSSNFHHWPFLYNGQITIIAETDDDSFRLAHLVGRHWVDGRKILLPAPSAPVKNYKWVQVIQDGQDVHVFQTDTQKFSAYRNGFNFADETGDVASALSIENQVPEKLGWELFPFNGNGGWQMAQEKSGLLISKTNSPGQIRRRSRDGQWQTIEGSPGDSRHTNCILLAHPAEDRSYVIVEDQKWSSAVIHRIDGNTIQPAHILLNGSLPGYLATWKRLGFGILLSWILHLILLLAGSAWMMRSDSSLTFEFGVQRVAIAHISRRGLALIIDLLFVMAIPALTIYFNTPKWRPLTEIQAGNALLQIERTIAICIDAKSFFPKVERYGPLGVLLERLPNSDLILTALYELAVLIGLKLWLEGRLGVTPGKWLCGIRVLKTTLRPAGFARTLLRNVLYWIDIPFFVTFLPAVVSMTLSPHRQRLGDRVADTIVVRAGSVPNREQ